MPPGHPWKMFEDLGRSGKIWEDLGRSCKPFDSRIIVGKNMCMISWLKNLVLELKSDHIVYHIYSYLLFGPEPCAMCCLNCTGRGLDGLGARGQCE